ncbi:MAG: ABC transporter ATP-binding protein [Xanthomonadales bacterium PRO6]|nr:ABC transporter ATP-binding protein [Xanthomonadales bacterium PRO6]
MAWSDGPHWPWLRVRPPEVEAVSLQLARGARLGVVGGSGSGKSTLARGLLGLMRPRAGVVRWLGEDLAGMSNARQRALRPRVQMVFQDPWRSLDPMQRIDAMLDEALRCAPQAPAAGARATQARALLDAVGLHEQALRRWPSQFSGGQRQRIAIARALATAPEVLVCDEATSALDHDTRNQVLDLLDRLAHERGLALLFITHDLDAVARLCEQLLVLEGGRVVERGATAERLVRPRSRALQEMVAALPRPDHRIHSP